MHSRSSGTSCPALHSVRARAVFFLWQISKRDDDWHEGLVGRPDKVVCSEEVTFTPELIAFQRESPIAIGGPKAA